jgi:DNA polymerase-1
VIVTGDKDMSQLVTNAIAVYDIAKEAWLDEAGVRERFGVAPCQIPDLLALHGDSVDNIPGVPGIGEKTARQILAVYATIDDLGGSSQLFGTVAIRARDQVFQRIEERLDQIRMSRKLATICCDVPLGVSPEALRYRKADDHLLQPLCNELGFLRLMEEIPVAQPTLF